MQDAHCTDSSGRSDCLWRVKCNITGASCPKMDAILKKLDDTETVNTMSNNAKNTATPKTVAEAAVTTEETTIPNQYKAATDEKVDAVLEEVKGDQVLDNSGKVLFSGMPDEVKNWLLKQPTMIYAVRQAKNNDLVVSTVYVEEEPLKLSLVQRAKVAAEKLKKNKKALAILGGAVVVAGLTIKANRKESREAVADDETLDDIEVTIENPDDDTDSL